MIFVISINVGMALMMIIIYARYSKFRLSSAKEIEALHNKISQEIDEKKSLQTKLLLDSKADSDKIQELLREIDELRKAKEGEVKLRLEAEKQIELALQKTDEIQKRMHDWSVVQDAVMKDSKDAIVKVGNELFKKLNDSYKNEVETNKNLLGKFSKNISDFFEKSVASVASRPAIAVPAKNSTSQAPVPASTKAATTKPASHEPLSPKLISDLVETMKANGWLANKDYFLAANFDEQKAKLFFCETAFVSLDKLYIIDFKASHYLEEYLHSKDEKVLIQKLDRYLDYLNNPKYLDSIVKVLSASNVKFEKTGIVIALASKEELQTLRDINYFDKARKIASEILDVDGVNNLVL